MCKFSVWLQGNLSSMYRAACVAKLARLADSEGPITRPSQEDMNYIRHAHAKIMMIRVQVSCEVLLLC